MLATSREPLAVPGERVQRLEPLPTAADGSGPAAAVELFLDRAATHGVSWHNADHVLDTIRQVCQRLDGIPLAIELAAARTRAISPAELLAYLDDRLRLLAWPSHWSAHARQQTLEAAIAWSYDLLTPEEQATLRRLAVFHGGFSLAAAAAVCADIGDELDTLDRVTALVDRSVLSISRREAGHRYRLLESIGLFAEGRLREAQEQEPARDRHARFFLELVREAFAKLQGPEQAAWAARLDAEHDNLIAALGWCLDGNGAPNLGAELAARLGRDWTLRGRSNVAKRWLQRALELGADVAPATRVAVLLTYALLSHSISDVDAAKASAAEAVEIARETGDVDARAEALALLAFPDQGSDGRAGAIKAAAELRSVQDRLSTPRAQVRALLGAAQVALATGDARQARADASTAREIARQAGDDVRLATTGFWLAFALALASDLRSARGVIREAVDDALRSGYQMLVVDNLLAESSLALAGDDLEAARGLLPKALAMLREQQRFDDIGTCLYVAAAVELGRGFPEQSALFLGAARRLKTRLEFQFELLLPEIAELGDRLLELLGERRFAETLDGGSAMSLDELVDLISVPEPV